MTHDPESEERVEGVPPSPPDDTDEDMTDYDEDDSSWNPGVLTPDGRQVVIMKTMCSTCIFRSGNLMQLNPGRVKDMTEQTDASDTNVTCHKTLGTDQGAICRGSFERRPGQIGRIAERIGALKEITEEEVESGDDHEG